MQQLKQDIDADGSGEISLEEYATWLLNGKIPLAQTGITNQVAQYKAYNQFIMPKLESLARDMLNLELKDTRSCKLKFNMGIGKKYTGEDPGMSATLRVGLTDGKDKDT